MEGRAHASLYRRLLFSSRLELWGVKRLCRGHSFIPGRLLPSIATAASGRETPPQAGVHSQKGLRLLLEGLEVKPIGAAAASQPEEMGPGSAPWRERSPEKSQGPSLEQMQRTGEFQPNCRVGYELPDQDP